MDNRRLRISIFSASSHRTLLGRAVEITEAISYLEKLWIPYLHINPFCLTTPHEDIILVLRVPLLAWWLSRWPRYLSELLAPLWRAYPSVRE